MTLDDAGDDDDATAVPMTFEDDDDEEVEEEGDEEEDVAGDAAWVGMKGCFDGEMAEESLPPPLALPPIPLPPPFVGDTTSLIAPPGDRMTPSGLETDDDDNEAVVVVLADLSS